MLRRHIFCSKKTYFLHKEDTIVFEKKTYSVGRRKIIFRPKYTAVRGPDHWAIFAQQECLSKETLSLANPGRGLPSPQGLFPPAKLRTLVFLPPKYNSHQKRTLPLNLPGEPGWRSGGTLRGVFHYMPFKKSSKNPSRQA